MTAGARTAGTRTAETDDGKDRTVNGSYRVPFHGTRITVTGDWWVALSLVCEAMGLDPFGRRKRLRRMSRAVMDRRPVACTGGGSAR